jgi:hypothetical protein
MSGTIYTVDPAVLQQRLADAQDALHQLMIGKNANVISYNQGAGAKSVTYSPADMPTLRAYIAQLIRQLGYQSPRRAIGLRYTPGRSYPR